MLFDLLRSRSRHGSVAVFGLVALPASAAFVAACGLAGVSATGGEFGGGGGASSSRTTGPSGGTSSNQGGSGGATSSGSGATGGSTASSGSTATSGGSTTNTSASSGTPPVCGDGNLTGGEECDDGNTVSGDRCSADCKIEHPDTCPGTAISIAPGTSLVIADTTNGADDTFQHASSGNCFAMDYPGADLIYAVTPTAAGTLTANLSATFNDHVLHARTSCAVVDDFACAFAYGAGNTDTITFSVTANTSYYVIVDSFMSTAGAFTLTLTL